MMDIRARRIQKFKALETDIWYSKLFKRLKPQHIEVCMDWLEEFGDSDRYGHHVNRIFVENFCDRKQGKAVDAIIWELLSLLTNPGGNNE